MKISMFVPALVMSVTVACSTMNINVPALEGVSDSQRLPGKVIWHELISDTPQETRAFYTGLFGWEFESLSDSRLNYQLIRHKGKLIGGLIDQNQLPTDADISQWVALFAVEDIRQAVSVVNDAGGTVFTPPTSLGDRGEIAVVADPQGAFFALLQTASGDPADSDELPAVGDFLWDELWTDSAEDAAGFYARLAPYTREQKTLGNEDVTVPYQVLASSGRVRAGIRDNPFEGLPPIWLNYLRIADETQLQSILSRVDALGGSILVPATVRPGGGTVAIITGPSGAGIALQTWSDDQTFSEVGGAQ